VQRLILGICSLAALLIIITTWSCDFVIAEGASLSQSPSQTDRSGSSASPSSDTMSFGETLAKDKNNRQKSVSFGDQYNLPCPRLTALMYVSGVDIGFVMPNFSLAGIVLESDEGVDAEAIGYRFFSSNCRLSISAKKFALRNAIESEVPLNHEDPLAKILEQRRKTGQSKSTRESSGSDSHQSGIVKAERNGINLSTKAIDQDGGGTTELHRRFASSEPAIGFSGMVWFGPKNFSIYIGNAPKDLTVESHKNTLAGAYELDIRNMVARIRLLIRKDVRVGDTWMAELDE
jgi:hypothetical protein